MPSRHQVLIIEYFFLSILQHKLAPGEYRAPRKMIEFSRKHQEDKLVKEQEDGLKQLTEDEVDLEVCKKHIFDHRFPSVTKGHSITNHTSYH